MKRYGWWPDCMHEQEHGAYVRAEDVERMRKAIRQAVSTLEGIPLDKVQRVVNKLSYFLEPAQGKKGDEG